VARMNTEKIVVYLAGFVIGVVIVVSLWMLFT
jgi:hypothetical protein